MRSPRSWSGTSGCTSSRRGQLHAHGQRRAPGQAHAVRRRGAPRAGRTQARRAFACPTSLPRGPRSRRDTPEVFDDRRGHLLTLVEAPTDVEYDLDHVALCSARPRGDGRRVPALRLRRRRAGTRVEVGGAYIEFHAGEPGEPERPLLNHLAVLVDSADEVIADARDLEIEVESVVDAANTYAAFLWGPERVRIEYVEHKPTFSLT